MRSSVAPVVLGIVASTGLISFTVGAIARQLPISDHLTLIAAVFSPYLMLAAPLCTGVIVLWLIRHWAAATLVAVVVVSAVMSHIGPTASTGDEAPSQSTKLRVMTANMMLGSADPNALVHTARNNADIVALQELTPEAALRLERAGLDATFPYKFAYPVEGGGGTGLWSRYPLQAPTVVRGFEMVFIRTRVALDTDTDTDTDNPWLLVAHLGGPWPQPIEGWNRDIERLRTVMTETATAAGNHPVIVAGDFNSTMDMQPFRQLLQGGYVDAAASTGADRIATFPQDAAVPPFLAIDHALIRNCTAASVAAVPSPGSDHRALLVDLFVPHR